MFKGIGIAFSAVLLSIVTGFQGVGAQPGESAARCYSHTNDDGWQVGPFYGCFRG